MDDVRSLNALKSAPEQSGDSDLSRRGFVAVTSSLAAGFALATHPVMAQSLITTDAAGLDTAEVKVPVKDAAGTIPAYMAKPAGKTGVPVILVVQEIFGVHEHIRDVCRRLAKLGYLAIAPELYFRQGNVSQLTEMPKIFEVVNKVPDAQVMGDLDASLAFAGANGGDTGKTGITGFCWGGRITWLYASHNPSVKAAVAWYGPLVGQTNELKPKMPVDLAPSLTVPVLGLYGGADTGITADHVAQMRAALPKNNKYEIVVYPDTPHAFNADYRPSYRKEAAQDGWARMQAFFKTYGVI